MTSKFLQKIYIDLLRILDCNWLIYWARNLSFNLPILSYGFTHQKDIKIAIRCASNIKIMQY